MGGGVANTVFNFFSCHFKKKIHLLTRNIAQVEFTEGSKKKIEKTFSLPLIFKKFIMASATLRATLVHLNIFCFFH